MAIRQGEIYWAEVNFATRRPVVVVSREDLNRGDYIVCVPLTSQRFEQRRRLPNVLPLSAGQYGLALDSIAQAEAITLLLRDDLDVDSGPIDRLSTEDIRGLIRAVGNMMDAECDLS